MIKKEMNSEEVLNKLLQQRLPLVVLPSKLVLI
jgi:hypothetical protein